MTTIAAFFVMASQGATFAIALIKQRVTGQIGGNAAAYNVGSVAFPPFTAFTWAVETNAFPDAGIVALIVASLVPSSSNRKASTKRVLAPIRTKILFQNNTNSNLLCRGVAVLRKLSPSLP